MKKLSSRELRLLSITALVLVTLLTVVLIRRQLEARRARNERMQAAQSQLDLQEAALEMRPTWLVELQRIRGQLPRHPVGVDLKPRLSREVQNLAAVSGLTLTNLTPDSEEYVEGLDIYKTSIRCQWRASSEQLVRFLAHLQRLGPVLDVETLRIREKSGNRKGMTGSFTLEFVYSREEGGEPDVAPSQEILL